MSWRTVVVSSRAKLELKNSYLVIRSDIVKRILIDEISVLIVENTGCAVTVALLAELWERKVDVIFCDVRRNPGAQLLPYYNSCDCSASLHSQIKWSKDITDLVWTEIVKEKIKKQAEHLEYRKLNQAAQLLESYISEVLPADESNREGHAARVYFNALFGNSFSRSDDVFVNAALNYGYSILLSAVNREIVMNGYLTQLGIFHKNVFNPFNLGSDLMEPFRPLVDSVVCSMEVKEEFSGDDKMLIVDFLNQKVVINKTKQTVLNAISIYVHSIFESIEEKDLSLIKFYKYDF